jgi:hypothetical protein
MADGLKSKRQTPSAIRGAGMAKEKASGLPMPAAEAIKGGSIERLRELLRQITRDKPEGREREGMISEVTILSKMLVKSLRTSEELRELKMIFMSYPDDNDVMPERGEILVSINEREREMKK